MMWGEGLINYRGLLKSLKDNRIDYNYMLKFEEYTEQEAREKLEKYEQSKVDLLDAVESEIEKLTDNHVRRKTFSYMRKTKPEHILNYAIKMAKKEVKRIRGMK